MAANSSIDWAVARKKGVLIYPGELLEIPPVFEEADAQNRPVPRAQVVDAKSFYGEKGGGGANSGGNALLSGASTTGSVWDMYNNFGFKYHNSYPTTQGYMKPYSDFAGRNWSKQALKFKGLSSKVKGFGNLGTGLMVFQSAYNFYNGDKSVLNYIDGGVGLTGLGNSALLYYGVGSVVVGPLVAYYGFARLLYDFGAKPNIERIQDNIMNDRSPLDGVYNPTTGMYDRPMSW